MQRSREVGATSSGPAPTSERSRRLNEIERKKRRRRESGGGEREVVKERKKQRKRRK
jgi:hypothetical protein